MTYLCHLLVCEKRPCPDVRALSQKAAQNAPALFRLKNSQIIDIFDPD